METIRRYIERKYFNKEEGGGAFFKWFDVDFSKNKINVSHRHSMGEGKHGISLPKTGSGSSFTLTIKEAKILNAMLSQALSELNDSK